MEYFLELWFCDNGRIAELIYKWITILIVILVYYKFEISCQYYVNVNELINNDNSHLQFHTYWHKINITIYCIITYINSGDNLKLVL